MVGVMVGTEVAVGGGVWVGDGVLVGVRAGLPQPVERIDMNKTTIINLICMDMVS
jgi:hypothetical protein